MRKSKGLRFDHDFLVEQIEKRKRWKLDSKRAGHGGEFDTRSPLEQIKKENKLNLHAHASDQAYEKESLVIQNELPEWIIRIIESDHEVAIASTNKSIKLESPHKRRLVQGIKKPEELNNNRLKEHWLQVRYFYTLETQFNDVYTLAFSVPNGGYRTSKTASLMSYEGQKAGIPDVFIPIPRNGFHGFFLELKTEKGTASKDQKFKIELLRKQGYFVEIAKGFEQAINITRSYLKGEFNAI